MASTPGTVRFRLTARQQLSAVAAPMVLLVVVVAVSGGGLVGNLALGAMVGTAVLGLLRTRAGLDLRDDAAVVRGLASEAVVPWSTVTNVEVSQRGSRQLMVLETERRFYRPLAPMSSRLLADPAFEAKARQIGDRWRSRRGDG